MATSNRHKILVLSCRPDFLPLLQRGRHWRLATFDGLLILLSDDHTGSYVIHFFLKISTIKVGLNLKHPAYQKSQLLLYLKNVRRAARPVHKTYD